MSPDVIIVGGGIWGLSIAQELRRMTRLRVLVLERRSRPVAETTGQSAGLITFVRDELELTQAALDTVACLERLEASEARGERLFKRCGSVVVASSTSRLTELSRQFDLVRAAGIDVDALSARQLARRVPGIRAEAAAGGFFVRDDGLVHPLQFGTMLARSFVKQGGSIKFGTIVKAIRQTNQGPQLATNTGTLSCAACVIAAGPWSERLLSGVGATLPAVPKRLYLGVTGAAADARSGHPVVRVPELDLYVQPESGRYLLGALQPEAVGLTGVDLSSEWSTDELAAPLDVLSNARARLAALLPDIARLPLIGSRQGLATFTPGGLPLLGRVDEDSQILVATGCNGVGLSLAGGIARWATSALTEPDLDPFILGLSPLRRAPVSNQRDRLPALLEAHYVDDGPRGGMFDRVAADSESIMDVTTARPLRAPHHAATSHSDRA